MRVGDGEEDADDDAGDEVADSIDEPEETEAPAADRHVFGSERAASIGLAEWTVRHSFLVEARP